MSWISLSICSMTDPLVLDISQLQKNTLNVALKFFLELLHLFFWRWQCSLVPNSIKKVHKQTSFNPITDKASSMYPVEWSFECVKQTFVIFWCLKFSFKLLKLFEEILSHSSHSGSFKHYELFDISAKFVDLVTVRLTKHQEIGLPQHRAHENSCHCLCAFQSDLTV